MPIAETLNVRVKMRALGIAAGVVVAGSVTGAGETGITMKITGLPPLPASFGTVRFADLPKIFERLSVPMKERWLIAPGQPASPSPNLPSQQPSYRAGSLVVCF